MTPAESKKMQQELATWFCASYGRLERLLSDIETIRDQNADEESPVHGMFSQVNLKELKISLDEAVCQMASCCPRIDTEDWPELPLTDEE
jgi:hypothetical protein